MLVYRIASPKFIEDLSGTGAKQYGGRWNNKGIKMMYFAESRAMAVMEVLVHLRPAVIDQDFSLAVFEIPDDNVLTIDVKELPKNWKEETAIEMLKRIGDQFIKDNQYLVMKVPSVIVEEEYNIVLNPNHTQSAKVRLIGKRVFRFDRRFKY